MKVMCILDEKEIPKEYDPLYDALFSFVESTKDYLIALGDDYEAIECLEPEPPCTVEFFDVRQFYVNGWSDTCDLTPLYEYASKGYKMTTDYSDKIDDYCEKVQDKFKGQFRAPQIVKRVREEKWKRTVELRRFLESLGSFNEE